MEDVARQPRLRVPVDVLERKTLRVPLNRLLQTLPEDQQVVDLFVGPNEPVVDDILESLHCRLNVRVAELESLPLEPNLIELPKLFDQNRFQ